MIDAKRIAELKQWLWHPSPKYYSTETRDDIRRDIDTILAGYEAALPLLKAVRVIPKDYVSMYPFLGESGEYWHDVHGAAIAYRERSERRLAAFNKAIEKHGPLTAENLRAIQKDVKRFEREMEEAERSQPHD